MKNKLSSLSILFFLISLHVRGGSNSPSCLKDHTNGDQKALTEQVVQENIKNHSVLFLENKGQMTDMNNALTPFVLFKMEAPGMNMYVTESGLTYAFIKQEEDEKDANEKNAEPKPEKIKVEWSRVDLVLKGATIKKENIITEGASLNNNSYFFPHCPNGIYGVKEFEKVIIKDVYPGIDWILYGTDKTGFKYDFIVHAHANPDQIQLVYSSKEQLKLNESGEIEIKTKLGTLSEKHPVSFQNGTSIQTQFIKTANQKNDRNGYDTYIQFTLGNYNSSADLTIDPQLVWGTFYGGNDYDGPDAAACDANGNLFITGYTSSTNFPVQNAGTYYQGTCATCAGGNIDAFIVKFNNAGVRQWSTYYGGGVGGIIAEDITIDNGGNVLTTGWIDNGNLPLFNPGGGAYFQTFGGGYDAYILKFDNAGNRLWATYYGGSGIDWGYSITTDNNNTIFLTGGTRSTNLPVLNSGTYFQGALAGNNNAFIAKFSNTEVMQWGTYYGSTAYDYAYTIATDNNNNVFVGGSAGASNFPTQNAGTYFQAYGGGLSDGFILKFDNLGNRLWATFYGGNADETVYAIAVDNAGNLFAGGSTSSSNFPILFGGPGTFFQGGYAGGNDAFMSKFDNTGIQKWSTYYGGPAAENMAQSYDNMEIDNCGNVYVSFETSSATVITTLNPGCGNYFNGTLPGGGDIFLTKFTNTGVLLWATYFGGPGWDIREGLAVDNNNNLFLTGEWISATNTGYPVTNPGGGAYYTNPAGGHEGFVSKFIPTPLTINVTGVNGSCSCNGSATVAITSCVSPSYTFSWSTGATTQSISNLCGGTYSVIVTDVQCGIDSGSVMITGGNSTLALTANGTNVTCGSSTGTATANPTGGTTPYTYLWNNGQTTTTATGLGAGTYTITVTDANGCTQTATVTITNTNGPTAQINTSTNVLCFGGNSGTATASATGGTSPYTYLWSNAQTNANATGLIAGTYTVTVTDANGCTSTQTIIITQPTAINLSATATTNVLCNGGNSGVATASTTGGTAPYTYVWNNAQTNAIATNLIAGTYTVVVTDANGCTSQQTVTITQPTVITASATSTNTSCGNSTGTATASASGGVGPYTYSWNNSQTTITATGLGAATFTVYITDANGCTQTTTATVNNSTGPTASTSLTTAILCNAGNNASATASATGGTSPYTYSWNNSQTNSIATGLAAGTYTVTVTDANGCTSQQTITITEPSVIAAIATSTPDTCSQTNGTANAIASGGTGPYTYSWSTSSTSQNISNLTSGNYTVIVTDANGCTQTQTVNVGSVGGALANAGADVDIIQGSSTTLSGSGGVSYSWSPAATLSCSTCQNPIATPTVTTTYYIIVTNANGCTGIDSVTVFVDTPCNGKLLSTLMPNAFTPNNDGRNDELCVPANICIINFKLTIYDRWGEKVFETDDISKCWDGKYKGVELNTAVFVYFLDAELSGGETMKFQGNISLIK